MYQHAGGSTSTRRSGCSTRDCRISTEVLPQNQYRNKRSCLTSRMRMDSTRSDRDQTRLDQHQHDPEIMECSECGQQYDLARQRYYGPRCPACRQQGDEE